MSTVVRDTAAGRRQGLPSGMIRSLARVRTPSGEVVGSGFLIDTRQVITCTHVVLSALRQAGTNDVVTGIVVGVDFPLTAPGTVLQAEVEVAYPVGPDGGGDITVLTLPADLPPDLEPARLVVAPDVWGHPFRAFGFPRRLDDGVWVGGVLRAAQSTGWVQMDSGASGYAVEAGFSGGAVWDDELAGIVGMTVAADTRAGHRTAFLIPAATLLKAWPALAGRTLPPCPYRGLRPFRPSDAPVFFGREELTERLVREVRRRPLTALVGPSGSGKSSVAFAGVIPRLSGSQAWLTVAMRPDQASSPLFALAAALAPLLEPDQTEVERLATATNLEAVLREGHLVDVVDRILARNQGEHLLLVVDQLEELFARDPSAVGTFGDAVLPALRTGSSGHASALRILCTLRADFLGDALRDPRLAEALEGSVVTIGQMGGAQLRAIIEEPLPPGVRYEEGLVERILHDVGSEPGGLPLLEFALTLLWEHQEHGELSHAAYQELGEVDGALSSYAERVFVDHLHPDDTEDARRLLVQLVRPSEAGPAVRRVARRFELGEARWELGRRLAATRLLVVDRDAAGAESVELVHEALIDGWWRLREWVEGDAAFRSWQERLRSAVAAWENVGHDPGALLRGAPLAEAERWQQARSNDLADPELRFIRASRTAQDRAVQRLRLAVAALTVLLLLASGLGGLARWKSVQVTSQLLADQAGQVARDRPDVAALLAASAYRTAQTPQATTVVTQLAGNERLDERFLGDTDDPVYGVEFDPTDPDQIRLFGDGTITVWNTATDRAVRRWTADAPIGRTTSSANGVVIAIQQPTAHNTLVLWYPGRNDRSVPLADADLIDDPNQVQMAFSPDGTALAVCTATAIRVWDVTNRLLRAQRAKGTQACGVGFTGPDTLAYLDGGEIRLWDLRNDPGGVASDRHVAVMSPAGQDSDPTNMYTTLAVSPDRTLGLVDDGSGTTSAWDLTTLTSLGTFGHGIYGAVSFTPDSHWAILGSETAAVLVDLISRRPVKSYTRNAGGFVNHAASNAGGRLALSPDGHSIAFPTGGATAALINTAAVGDPPVIAQQVAVAPDGTRLVTLDATGEVRAVSTSEPDSSVLVPHVTDADPTSVPVALAPDGQHLAARSDQPDQVLLTDLVRPHTPAISLPANGQVTSVQFDPVGGRFLVGTDASGVTVWSVTAGNVFKNLPLGGSSAATQAAVDADGQRVATCDQAGYAQLWASSSDTWTALPIPRVRTLSFSPDGRWLAARTDADIRIWDVVNSQELPIALPAAQGFALLPAKFSADGELVAAQRLLDEKSVVSVWRVSDGQPVGGLGASVRDFAFLPDGHRLAVASIGVFVTPFDPEWALDTICRVVRHRDLTTEEWSQYAGGLDRVPACL